MPTLALPKPTAFSGGGEVTVENDILVVKYKAGAVGSKSGVTTHIAPSDFPKDQVTLKFEVFFEKGWAWKQGGKLPGVYIGEEGASGGDWAMHDGSVRVIFKEQAKCCGYVYIPLEVAPDHTRKTMDKAQTREYRNLVSHTDKGDHIWRDGAGDLKIGEWNTIELFVKLNTPGKQDGLLRLTVNGESHELKMVFRDRLTTFLHGISLTSFFGGSAKAAAAPKNAVTKFRNFVYV